MDPYKILGINEGASLAEIRCAYRKQVARHHPDSGGDNWIFQMVQDAYDELNGKRKPKSMAHQGRNRESNSSMPSSEPVSEGPAGLPAKPKREGNSEPESPKSDPISEFDFSLPKAHRAPVRRRRSKDNVILFNVVGAVGGAVCALFLGWLIVGSDWFKPSRLGSTSSQSRNAVASSDSIVKSKSVSRPFPLVDGTKVVAGGQDQRRSIGNKATDSPAPPVDRSKKRPNVAAIAPNSFTKKKYGLAFHGSGGVQFPDLKFDRYQAWTIDVVFTPGNQVGAAVFSNVHNAGIALNVGDYQPVFAIRDGGHYNRLYADEKHSPDTPIYLSIVIDRHHIRMFIDGKLQSKRMAIPKEFRPSERTFFLGANPSSRNRPEMCFTGTVRALRVSRTVRYDSDFTPVDSWELDSQTILLSDFGAETGAKLNDRSMYGNRGTITDATWFAIPDARPSESPLEIDRSIQFEKR